MTVIGHTLEKIFWEGEESTLKILIENSLIKEYGVVDLEKYQSFNKLYS